MYISIKIKLLNTKIYTYIELASLILEGTPFYFEDQENYLVRLNETVNTVIEVDIPSVFPIEYDSVSNIKKLVRLVCHSHPCTPNIKELLQRMDMGDNYKGLYRFLDYLHKAKILNVMRAKTKGDIFTKHADR